MARGVSLANKCQLLFGAAIVLIIFAALCVPWFMLASIIDRGEVETARRIASLWPETPAREVTVPLREPEPSEAAFEDGRASLRHIPGDRLEAVARGSGFAAAAAEAFVKDADLTERNESLRLGELRLHRYARALRDESGRPTDVVIVEYASRRTAGKIFTNRVYLAIAGLFAGALAVLVFYLITTRLILGPVRRLRETADRVREGDLARRAEIRTGDEFEQLGDAFNRMLSEVEAGQDRLRGLNKSLEQSASELKEQNRLLFEADRIKGDFVAGVSHELRTPLNSIIGFAELLEEIATRESTDPALAPDPGAIAKRRRFIQNILGASRSLLEMINDLLDIAKIEAGKMDLHVEPTDVASECEGLIAMIRPQAERKGITLAVEVPSGGGDSTPPGAGDEAAALPVVSTDPRKLRQIIFNFLSNAVKFTPEGGRVTLRAERLVGGDTEPRVRVSVLDTGPGIAPEDQQRIFEKFVQVGSGHTGKQPGTGLGLPICRDLTAMIQGEIQLVSEVGRGSMFSLILPLRMDPAKAPPSAIRAERNGELAPERAPQDQTAGEPARAAEAPLDAPT